MEKTLIVAVVVTLLVAMIRERPERKPGNLAPIQMISALGAWALVLADASAIAIAIREHSVILLLTASATLALVLILLLRHDSATPTPHDAPEPVKLAVEDLRQLLGGARRLGMNSLEAVVVNGRCPGIGVAVGQQGRVIVRIRHDVARWLERHQQPVGAGPETAASFARFTVLHELAHVLNGDHRTFRFVRSVVVAHVVWLAGAIAAAASRFFGAASVVPFAVAASILLLFVAQSLVARRFIAERERLADWRAMQTLPPADAARLLERRGRRRGVPNPTQLEKLMTDMKVQSPPSGRGGLLSLLIATVWPGGDDIHARCERVSADRAGGEPRPVLWAALIGMQCGFLAVSASLAAMLAFASMSVARPDLAVTTTLAIFVWIAAAGAILSALRVDPARMSVRRVRRRSRRLVVGVVYYLAFAAAALALYRFHVRFGLAFMPSQPIFAVLLLGVAGVTGVCVWVSVVVGGSDGGGELRLAPRASWVQAFPLLAAMALVLVPLSVTASQRLGTGSFLHGGWVPLMLLSFAAFVVSTGMARSTSPALRMMAPMAVLDTPAPVFGFRVFWRDFYVDLARTTLARGAAAGMAAQATAIAFFVAGAALVMQALTATLNRDTAVVTTFFGAFGLMALVLIIPDRYRAYSGSSARLLDTSRLKLFERLLAAARAANAPAAERLSGALARWLRNDQFPAAVLPEARCVWPLEPLLALVRLARATGESAVLERWRAPIRHALGDVIAHDAVAVAPRQRPSLHWTTLAATIIDETEIHDAFPFERMLDRIEVLLDERLDHGTANLLTDVVAASRLLRRHERRGGDRRRLRSLAHSASIVSRPLLRQSLAELCELAEAAGDDEMRQRLAPIVRSRSWEGLQLNPRKDVLLILDCYLAAASLGEVDARQEAAGVIIGELAERVSHELSAVAAGEA